MSPGGGPTYAAVQQPGLGTGMPLGTEGHVLPPAASDNYASLQSTTGPALSGSDSQYDRLDHARDAAADASGQYAALGGGQVPASSTYASLDRAQLDESTYDA